MKKKKSIILLFFVFLLASSIGAFIWHKKRDTSPVSVYEALVLVRDQQASDPAEDARSSLKTGDVLLLSPEGHDWSDTEKTSYLILKMRLSAKEAEKLLSPLEREMDKSEKEAELAAFKTGREVPAEELKSYEEELDQRRETIRPRRYHIDMAEFPGFEPDMLMASQPYQDKVFDWGLVEPIGD